MSESKLNKIEVARRQIDASIRMFFANEDSVPIHTLIMAAYRILRDLAAKQNTSYMDKIINSIIKPGTKKEFWHVFQRAANFFKHADRDSEEILNNFDEEVNDFIILVACLYYQDLGHQHTPEMITLIAWFMSVHSEYILEESFSVFQSILEQTRNDLVGKSRKKQLEIGKKRLRLARAMFEDYQEAS